MSALFYSGSQDEIDALPNYSYLKVQDDFFSVDDAPPRTWAKENLSPSMGPTSSRSSDVTDGAVADHDLFSSPAHLAPLPVDGVDDLPEAADEDEPCLTEKASRQTRTTRCYCRRRSPTADCRGCDKCCCCCCRLVRTPPPLFVALRMGSQSPRYLGSRYYKPLVLAPLQLH